jgi:nucleoside-diphosphate-sugar epimerase
MAGFDYVIHLAFATSIPESIRDPVGTTYNNIDLGVKMLQLSKEAGVKKFLFPSTASLYGNQPLPWREDMPALPSEPYSLQKYAMERYCRYYAQNGLPTVVFRFFQVFGENQRQDQVLAAFFRCKREGKPIPVTQTSAASGLQSAKRDFVYAGDIAGACCRALTAENVGGGEIINLASGYNYTIREIAELISDKIESIPKRSFDLDEHLADVAKARELLGWTATTDIKEWLKQYVKTL